tara:strand:+ start:6964 stop:7773 length:810 start_codon:yes stop_codon:yes gene_type:complete
MNLDIPLNRESAIIACKRMEEFYADLVSLYEAHSMDLSSNRGRRNILMSAPMEKCLADSLRETQNFDSVLNDGRTGEADITVVKAGLHTEIECKLTSPHQSSGAICFQTDHDTLAGKGSLDYIYMIANEDFDGFFVAYFSGLTIQDFRGLSPGARGKVQMFKHLGMKKATILVGNAKNSVETALTKLDAKYGKMISDKILSITAWKQELESLKPSQEYQIKKINEKIIRSNKYVDDCLNKKNEMVKIINQRKPRYTFEYENLGSSNEIA